MNKWGSLIIFVLGLLIGSFIANIDLSYGRFESPFSLSIAPEIGSPYDWINESQIHVFDDKVVIDVKDAVWAKFTDTNSMDPVIDYGTNALQIIPLTEDDIHLGDIVSYESEYVEGVTIHRVIEIGEDDEGRYFILKGDNNPEEDPGKIRFSQVKRVLVGIVY